MRTKSKLQHRFIAIAFAFAMMFAACLLFSARADAAAVNGTKNTTALESVSLSPSGKTLTAGQSVQLMVKKNPQDATDENGFIYIWQSSNSDVATVSSSGLVTAKKAGNAVIYVNVNGKIATATITVINKPTIALKSISVTPSSKTLTAGQVLQLQATKNPSNTTDKNGFAWQSSNTNVATVTSSGKVTAKKAGTAKITVSCSGKTATAAITVKAKVPNVWYRTHVQTYGWQKYVKNGAVAGTTGKRKRLEGINIYINNLPVSGGIQYRTHIQTYGWEKGWKSNNAMSGTKGQSKRLEAIQIRLTGQMAKKYDVYYRVHAQHFGWMGWAKNGASAGTAGYSYRLEAIRICLVAKGGKAPGSTKNAFRQKIGDKFSDQIVALVNKYRRQAGAKPLVVTAALNRAAGIRAKETATLFSHFRPNGTLFPSVAPGVVWGENIEYKTGSRATVAMFMKDWMNSPGHRANILNKDWKSIGVGHYKKGRRVYAVQNFGF